MFNTSKAEQVGVDFIDNLDIVIYQERQTTNLSRKCGSNKILSEEMIWVYWKEWIFEIKMTISTCENIWRRIFDILLSLDNINKRRFKILEWLFDYFIGLITDCITYLC